jgi:hypothetical protein
MPTNSDRPGNQDDVDREIRIERMKRELDEASGGLTIHGSFGDIPLRLEEAFLAYVCEFETAQVNTAFDWLLRAGIVMEPPDELDDSSISAKLQEVLQALAAMRYFVECTDHLSDRELFAWLWSEGLREAIPDLSKFDGAWHTSPIGSCNEEDMLTFLKYYAKEEERSRWQEEFPNDSLPPRQPPPYDRDCNLPRRA